MTSFDRAPKVSWVLRQALALLFSLMAIRGIYDLDEGLERLRSELVDSLSERSMRDAISPGQIAYEQVSLKVRKFNTGLNADQIPDEDRISREHDALVSEAREYRRQSRGGQ
jgi:hypothetical protein